MSHKAQSKVCVLPAISQRDEAFVRQVITGVKGPFIDNVVTNCIVHVTKNLDEAEAPFNIQDMAWRLAGKHDPKQFKASTSIRLHEDPSGTYLMFPSECMVMTGIRCPELVLAAATRITRYYTEIYARPCRLVAYQVNNVHGVIDMGHPLDLEAIHATLPNSYHQTTFIKCVIFSFEVRHKVAEQDPVYSMQFLAEPVSQTGEEAKTPHHKTTAAVKQPARKKRKVSAGTAEQKEQYEEDAHGVHVVEYRRHKNNSVFTSAQLEVVHKAKKTLSRKKPKDPNYVAINVWESGRVGIMGRTEEHLIDAASQLAVFLAQFTMAPS